MHVSEPPAARVAPAAAEGKGTSPGTDRPGWLLPLLVVGGLTLAGAVIRILVARQAYFADEMSTFWIVSTNDFGGVISTVDTTAEISPPLSFVAAWLGAQVDLAPEAVRAPSLIAGCLTIPGIYLLGLRTVGRAAGLVAAALTALAPFMIYYSSEARGYALMMAFVLGSTLTLLLAVDERRTRWWALYAVFSCAAVYTHYTCVFVLAAQLAWVLLTHPEARRAAVVANFAAVAAYIPWVPGLKHDLDSPTTEILSALSPFTASYVRESLEHWSVGYPYGTVSELSEVPGTFALVLVGLGTLVALAGLVFSRGRSLAGLRSPDRRTLLIVGLALAAPVGAALFSAVGSTTIFSTRNIAASWPALALTFSVLLVSAGPWLRFVAAGLAIGCFAIGAVRLLQEPNERPHYQKAVELVEAGARPGDVVIDETGVLSPGPLTHIDPLFEGRQPVIRSRAPKEMDHPFTIFDPIVTPREASREAEAAAGGTGRIFVVTDVKGANLDRGLGSYELARRRDFPGIQYLVVQRYDRRDPARN